MNFVIDADHPALPGHFPGHPVVPGVVVLDRVLAAIEATHGPLGALRLPQVKFVQPLLPGEAARLAALGGPALYARLVALVSGAPARRDSDGRDGDARAIKVERAGVCRIRPRLAEAGGTVDEPAGGGLLPGIVTLSGDPAHEPRTGIVDICEIDHAIFGLQQLRGRRSLGRQRQLLGINQRRLRVVFVVERLQR